MKTILLVEDSKDYAEGISYVFSRKGYNVLVAESGEDGVRQAVRFRPDIILMDVMLPDQDGAETVSQIKQNMSLVRVPVVFLTALKSQGDVGTDMMTVQGENYPVVSKMEDHETIARVITEYLNGK